MVVDIFVNALFSWANTFIAIFIVIYAYLFLRKTKRHRDRRPWDFLFVGSFIFLIYQIFNIMVVSGVTNVSTLDLRMISNFTAFLYSGCVLLAFISQHDLILSSQLILISKKDEKEDVEVEIKVDE